MKTHDSIALVFVGVVFWIAGTLLYRWRGQVVFETTRLRYWINFVVTPVGSTLACLAVFRWLRIPAADWSSAALLVAIPGLIGEAVLLSNFCRWMPLMEASTAGRYGGFLFATYGLVLGVAEIITLQSTT